jgi:hypothetical protein
MMALGRGGVSHERGTSASPAEQTLGAVSKVGFRGYGAGFRVEVSKGAGVESLWFRGQVCGIRVQGLKF